MTIEQYLEQRNALMDDAEGLIADGKLEESEAKMQEVKDLDNKWEGVKVAQANLESLKDDKKATDIENKSEIVGGGKVIDNIKEVVTDESKVYENAWAKNLMNQDLTTDERNMFAKMNNLSNEFTHTTINTPTLIPDTVVAGIEALMEEQYPLLADVRKFNVSGNLTMNKHKSIDAGDAAWYTEATPTSDEENTFNQFTLTGHELSKAITVSWKMKSMAVAEFIPFIQREIASRMGVAKATAVVSGAGVGSNQPNGIVTALEAESNKPQVVEYEVDSGEGKDLSYEDIVDAFSRIHSSLQGGLSIYANSATIWNKLANIKDGVGRSIFIPDVSEGGVGRLFGRVVKADGAIANGDIIIGNADKGYILNTNEPMKLVTQDQAKARVTDYVAYEIVDGDVYETKAFAYITEQGQ